MQLLKKLELYGIRCSNLLHCNLLNWIKSLLSKSKQYIEIAPKIKANLELVKCGIPKEPILAPLLFLLHVNYLKNALRFLDPMFADDTNHFHTHKNINCLFSDVNNELI